MNIRLVHPYIYPLPTKVLHKFHHLLLVFS